MTLNINELRQKVNSTDVVDHIDLHANIKPFLSEMLDRLEAAEGGLETERMRLAACGVAALGYFEGCAEEYTSASLDDVLNLRKRLEAAEKERDWHAERCEDAMNECAALRSKIEHMEQQTPVAWTAKLALEHRASTLGFRVSSVNMWGENGVPLYVLPGAEGEEK